MWEKEEYPQYSYSDGTDNAQYHGNGRTSHTSDNSRPCIHYSAQEIRYGGESKYLDRAFDYIGIVRVN